MINHAISAAHHSPGDRSAAAAVSDQRLPADLDAQLQRQGFAVLPHLLSPGRCREMIALYPSDAAFRSRIVMARHGFGSGEYKYFDYPLPAPVQALRQALYPGLAALADRWQEQLQSPHRYPSHLTDFLRQCAAAGQTRPTPLLLCYGAGDYNCLHQDVYGALIFPLQIAILLSQPGTDFEGGEFILTEQRPRRQSRASVVPLTQGDAVIFPVRDRPINGSRGIYRAQMRHGVSEIRAGQRFTLGLIFHDAA
ncbi:MAG TPA: 2OG-Fe(II) oxygenase [Dongiaceae bacterium]